MLIRPRLGTAVWLSVCVVVAVIGFKLLDGRDILQLGAGLLILLFGVSTGFAWADWLVWIWLKRMNEYRQAMAVTPYLELVGWISRLNTEQTKIVPAEMYKATVEIIGGDGEPEYLLRTVGGPVPMWFVREFLEKCGDQYLYPVRRYADGTPERDWSIWFTDWCVHVAKVAVPHNGPHSAAWRDGSQRIRTFGLVGLSLLEEE